MTICVLVAVTQVVFRYVKNVILVAINVMIIILIQIIIVTIGVLPVMCGVLAVTVVKLVMENNA